MFRKLVTLVLIIAVLVLVVVFTWLNDEPVTVDLAFAEVETRIAVTFTLAFAAGWLFGLLCASGFVVKAANERRKLRKALRLSEEEVSSLRVLPMQDAD